MYLVQIYAEYTSTTRLWLKARHLYQMVETLRICYGDWTTLAAAVPLILD